MELLNGGSNLDLARIVAMLADCARTQMGRALCLEIESSAYFSIVSEALEKTAEAEALLYRRGDNPMQDFEDVRGSLARAVAGGVLSMKDLLDVAQTLRCAETVRRGVLSQRETAPRLAEIAEPIDPHKRLEAEIERCIISAAEMADGASAELASIRRRIKSAGAEIQDRLQRMIHSPALQKYLQDAIVTRRNGRYVLPVRQEYRQSVQGLVHDQSGSGQTLFIEPMAIVEINNTLRELAGRERDEIERILSVLTAEVEGAAADISRAMQAMATLDAIVARGELARRMKAVRPVLNDKGFVDIRRARHPLLDPEKVVPIDLHVGRDFTQLLITGPNTGGKTVALKTVGLFCVMAQAGLFIPAAEGSELPVFRAVYADIGDEQSIEQSLSTFSAHMTNIVKILSDADRDTLVLLDELGAGTDPTEGAALAIAILETLKARGCVSLATTHYSELKAYGMTTPGVVNASVEFDVETLRPTYRMSIGIPGRSNAFEISRRLGLDEDVIARAKAYVSDESVRFEDVIESAQREQRLAREQIENTKRALAEAESARREAILSRDAWIKQRDLLLERARAQAAETLAEARRRGETILEDMKKLLETEKNAGEIKPHRLRALQKQFDDALAEVAPAPSISGMGTAKGRVSDADLAVGMTVLYTPINQKGVVLALPDADGRVQLRVGAMKLMAERDRLHYAEKAEDKPRQPAARDIAASPRATLPLQLDLRGMTVDEACLETDQYLDDAVMAGLERVTIVHGKGTGALRAGVREYLKTHPHVKSMREGKYSEGEDGVSIVELK